MEERPSYRSRDEMEDGLAQELIYMALLHAKRTSQLIIQTVKPASGWVNHFEDCIYSSIRVADKTNKRILLNNLLLCLGLSVYLREGNEMRTIVHSDCV